MIPQIQIFCYREQERGQETNDPQEQREQRLCECRKDEIHIWTIPWKSYPYETLEFEILSPDERVRLEKFVQIPDRHRYALGHIALRKLLGCYGKIPPFEIKFRYEKYGKPYWDIEGDIREMQFNLSHSGEWIVIAISRDFSLGVDVEEITETKNKEKIVKHFYHPAEVFAYDQAPPQKQQELFYRYWTAKEAALKGVGDGLSRRIDSFMIPIYFHSPMGQEFPILEDQEAAFLGWHIQNFVVDSSHMASIAYKKMNKNNKV